MQFRCERFPKGEALIRTHLGIVVPFRDGYAEVDDPEVARALLEGPEIYGVTLVEGTIPPPQEGDGSAGGSLTAIVVPEGMSVSATESWIAGDPEKAAAVLAAEAASPSPRSTLITRAEAVVAAHQQ